MEELNSEGHSCFKSGSNTHLANSYTCPRHNRGARSGSGRGERGGVNENNTNNDDGSNDNNYTPTNLSIRSVWKNIHPSNKY